MISLKNLFSTPNYNTPTFDKSIKPYIKIIFFLCCFSPTISIAQSDNTSEPTESNTLRLGYAFSPNTLDPHYLYIQPNMSLFSHTHESLFLSEIGRDLEPVLATSWELQDENTWIIKLRENVTFHDGTPFTSKDVIYTYDRLREANTNDFREYLNSIENYSAVDDHTIKIVTRYPHPYLLHGLSFIFIIKAEPGITPADHTIQQNITVSNLMKGTGKYMFTEQDPAKVDLSNIVLEEYADYHGELDNIKHVRIVNSTNRGERLNHLLSNDVDVLEMILPNEIAQIREKGGYEILSSSSLRLMLLHLDQFNDNSPYIKANDGKPLKSNPFKDIRVRKAMTLAINKHKLIGDVLDNAGEVTTQLVPRHSYTSSPNLKERKFNPVEAKKLLAEAGYPKGFQLTLHVTNNRYINDKQIGEALAKMLTEVGITTELVDMPKSEFFPQALNHDFSLSMIGWSSEDGRVSNVLEPLLLTKNPDSGEGSFNLGRYSNKELDDIVIKARGEFNATKKINLLRYATELAINDYAIIPLYFQPEIYAYNKDWAFKDPKQKTAHYNATKFEHIGDLKE